MYFREPTEMPILILIPNLLSLINLPLLSLRLIDLPLPRQQPLIIKLFRPTKKCSLRLRINIH